MTAPAVRMPRSDDRDEWLRLRMALWPDCEAELHAMEMGTILADADRAAVFLSPATLSSRGRLAGFIEVSLRPWAEGCDGSPVGYVEGLYVIPEERGRGVGRALLLAAEAWARERGCSEIASEAHVENDRGRSLHSQLGYEETAVLVHFKKRLEPLEEDDL